MSGLTEQQISLIGIAFSIAKAKFEENAYSVCVPAVRDQFLLQARQLDEIAELLQQGAAA